MKKLLSFLLTNITGSEEFEIEITNPEEGKTTLEVMADSDIIGLIIGKEGKTIKNIRKILSIKATKEKTGVNITVNPRETSLT